MLREEPKCQAGRCIPDRAPRRAASVQGRRAGRQRRWLQRLAVGHRVAIGGYADRDVTLDMELRVPYVEPMGPRRELDRARRLVARAALIGRVIGPRRQVDPDPTHGRLGLIAALVRRRDRTPAAVALGGGVCLPTSGPPDGWLSGVRLSGTRLPDVRLSGVRLPGIGLSGGGLSRLRGAVAWLPGAWSRDAQLAGRRLCRRRPTRGGLHRRRLTAAFTESCRT